MHATQMSQPRPQWSASISRPMRVTRQLARWQSTWGAVDMGPDGRLLKITGERVVDACLLQLSIGGTEHRVRRDVCEPSVPTFANIP